MKRAGNLFSSPGLMEELYISEIYLYEDQIPMNMSAPSTRPHCALYPPAPCSPTAERIVCGSMGILNISLRQMSAVRAQSISSSQYSSCTRFVIYSFVMGIV